MEIKIKHNNQSGFEAAIENPAYNDKWNMWVARYFESQLKARVQLPEYVHMIMLSSSVKIVMANGAVTAASLTDLCYSIRNAILAIREELENMNAALEYARM